ncbi:MAG: hypothetical protein WCT52_05850 [Candidatus Micrarchaeia archaeon]
MPPKFNDTQFIGRVKTYHRLFESRAKKSIKSRFFPELLDYKNVLTAIMNAEKDGFDARAPIAEEINRIVKEETSQIARYHDAGLFSEIAEKRGRYPKLVAASWLVMGVSYLATAIKFTGEKAITLPKTFEEWGLAASTVILTITAAFLYKLAGRYENAMEAINAAIVNMASWNNKYDRKKVVYPETILQGKE